MEGCDQQVDNACLVPNGSKSRGQIKMKARFDENNALTCKHFIDGLTGLSQCAEPDACKSISPSCPITNGHIYDFNFEVDAKDIHVNSPVRKDSL